MYNNIRDDWKEMLWFTQQVILTEWYQVLIDLLNFIFETNDIETVEEAENYLETTTVKYENSAKKIIYMLKGYQNDGYVSYWY